jgi:phage terminase small subunit
MGKRGPAKTPTKILEQRGSWRAKTRPEEPEPGELNIAAPEWLSGVALEMWNELTEQLGEAGIAKGTDRLMLATLCKSYAEWRGAMSPSARLEWTGVLIRLAREFGMTPASRAGVSATKTAKKDRQSKTRFFKVVG